VKRRWASPFVAKIQQNNPTAIMGLTNGKTCAIIHTYAKQTGVNMNHDKLATLVGAGTIGLIGICAVSAVIGLGSLISTPAKSSSTPSVTAQPAPVVEAPATTAEIKSIVEPAVNQWTKDGWKIDSKTTASFEGCQEIARGAGTVMKMTPQGTAVERTPSSDIFQVKGKMNNNTEEMVIQCSRGPNATMMIIGRR